jgi:hypothetical protein
MSRRYTQRRIKQVNESAKQVRAQVKEGRASGRDAARHLYTSGVRTARVWERIGSRAWSSVSTEAIVRSDLRTAARGDAPIVIGPWLGEVGYEALYWVPFVRWFAAHYGVPRERLVVVSRGGVANWYRNLADTYVELLDLFSPEEFAKRNVERQASGDQKQLAMTAFDEEIIARVRNCLSRPDTRLCHPSAMFQLMRGFWLGTESLQRVLDYTRHALLPPAAEQLRGLPDRFVAVKFYTGRTLPDTMATRGALRALIKQTASDLPVVMLNTRLALDEHQDYIFEGLPGVITLDGWLTPQNNLGVQTEVIRRAELFIGTCGSLAWLAPLLGTETVAVYADEHLLTPHLYAADQIYASVGAAAFTPLHVRTLQTLGLVSTT